MTDRKNPPEFVVVLWGVTDEQLENITQDYVGLAEFGSEAGRATYEARRDACVAECERRGRMDIVERVRKYWQERAH